MSIRKSNDIANESDSRYNNVKTAKKRAKITERFDDTTHNPYPGDEALQYLSKKMDDVIDSTNAHITVSSSYASASGSLSTITTANQAQHLGSTNVIYIMPTDFYPIAVPLEDSTPTLKPTAAGTVIATGAGTFICNVVLPIGKVPTHVQLFGSDATNTQIHVYSNKYTSSSPTHLHSSRVFTIRDGNVQLSSVSGNFVSGTTYLTLAVTTNGADSLYGGVITIA